MDLHRLLTVAAPQTSIISACDKGGNQIYKHLHPAVIAILFCLVLCVIVELCVIIYLIRRSKVSETLLRAALIKQKEATLQAERKSMNKSLAFASASHDVRNSLAGITGLIDICRGHVTSQSELDKNFLQMNNCVSRLLAILNSVLDTSKVEAGKMQLEEVEFDMAQVIEESIDMFYAAAFKKGLEVIWDACDFSVLRCMIVKGDCRRFKQILDNLLGNAVKFTPVGHIVVRAWAKKKPVTENFALSPRREFRFRTLLRRLRLIRKERDRYTEVGDLDSIQHDPGLIEFVFDVEDTGIGIPKEKRASVFENYVQVKEPSIVGVEGTGLGLGIVESYVRLMGGEIAIKDKDPGERGACFSFNIFLKPCKISCEAVSSSNDQLVNNAQPNEILKEQKAYRLSNQALTFSRGLKSEGIQIVLFVNDVETRKITTRWMENIGLKVWMVQKLDDLFLTLESAKDKLFYSLNSSRKIEFIASHRFPSPTSCKMEEKSSCHEENSGSILPITTKNPPRKSTSRGYIMVMVDLNYGQTSEICSALKHFAKLYRNVQLKVVWLVHACTSSNDIQKAKDVRCDLLLQKPLHGSRLHLIFKLLQDLGGDSDVQTCESEIGLLDQRTEQSSGAFLQSYLANEESTSKQVASLQKPLDGMKILLVEDDSTSRHIISNFLGRFGASVVFSENGLDAFNLVKQALRDAEEACRVSSSKQVFSRYFSYAVILMDCQMPVMNGYEATRHIRQEEKHYGHYIPIIALTAGETQEEERMTMESGMDQHLSKPIKREVLLEAITKTLQKIELAKNTSVHE